MWHYSVGHLPSNLLNVKSTLCLRYLALIFLPTCGGGGGGSTDLKLLSWREGGTCPCSDISVHLCKHLHGEGKRSTRGNKLSSQTSATGSFPAAWPWGVRGTRGRVGSGGPVSPTGAFPLPQKGSKTVPERVCVENGKGVLKLCTLNRKLGPI